MLNLLTKTKPWMIASLLVATSVFGQDGGGSCAKPCQKECAPCPPKPCPKPCPQPCPPVQICPQPTPTCCPPWPSPVLNAAYNYPSRTLTRCPWDVSVDVSFVYWQPVQENMEPAMTASLLKDVGSVAAAGTTAVSNAHRSIVNMNFSFLPGFKVGLGMAFDTDNWDSGLEYTRVHGSSKESGSVNGAVATSTATPAAAGNATYVQNVFLPMQLGGGASTAYLTRFLNIPTGTQTLTSTYYQKWISNFDFLDGDLGRSYYVGNRFTVRSFVGARVAWINQKLYDTYTILNTTAGANPVTLATAKVAATTTSWGIGPRAGLNTNWMIGEGFRIIGNGSADLLYTQYRYNKTDTLVAAAGADNTGGSIAGIANAINLTNKAAQLHIGSLRTHLDLEMGFGWGTYFDCNNWYLDFSAMYGFQVFFDQNMFRFFPAGYESINAAGVAGAGATNATNYIEMPNSLAPRGNLYINGLTLTVKLDF